MSNKLAAQVNVEKLLKSEIRLTVSLPAKDFENFIEEATVELSKEIKMDGFRKGKIPKEVIERTVGKERILHEGAEKAIRKTYIDAIVSNKMEAIGEPKIEIKKISSDSDFEYSATVAVLPSVELEAGWKESVKSINNKFSKESVEVKENEIERELNFLAKQRAKIVTVNRPAEKGDQLEIDFQVMKGGVPIENGTAKKQQLVIGDGVFIPGFEDELVGASAGEEKKFDLKFPEKYHLDQLAGEKASFIVKVHLVQERTIPEIDDQFAGGIGKFKSLEELKNNLREGIEHEKKHAKEDKQKREIILDIVPRIQAEIPQILIDKEVETMMGELEQSASSMGLNKDAYLNQLKTTEQKMKEQWQKKEAVDRVKAALAIRKIAETEEISVSSKEIEERMNGILQYYKNFMDVEKKIDLERLYESTKGNIVNEKVFQYLMSI